MYVSVNTVVCNYLLWILELPLRKHVFCYLARGSKTYATNKYLSKLTATDQLRRADGDDGTNVLQDGDIIIRRHATQIHPLQKRFCC